MLIIATIVLGSCSEVITEDQLIGGKWLVTNGYEGGEIGSDSVCPSFDGGLEFIDDEKVYVIDEKKEFGYSLSESDEGMEITFFNPNGEIDFFKISMENEDAFGLNGSDRKSTRLNSSHVSISYAVF